MTKVEIIDYIFNNDNIEDYKLQSIDNKTVIDDASGNTILHILAAKGVKYIINDKNISFIKNKLGNTPLHFLTKFDEFDDFIISNPNSFIVQNNNGITPAHLLARKGCSKIINIRKFESSISHMSFLKRDNNGDTIFHYAAKYGNMSVLQHPLLSDIVNNDIDTPLHSIAKFTISIKRDKKLRDSMVDGIMRDIKVDEVFNKNNQTPLHFLAMSGSELVLNHPRICTIRDNKGMTPLHYLAREGITKVLEFVEAGSVYDIGGNTPLHYLAYSGCSKVLLNYYCATAKNIKGDTPLHIIAMVNGGINVLQHPAVSRIFNNKGKTPLHVLAQYFDKVNSKDSFHYRDLTKTLNEMLKHPDIAAFADKDGNTPLHILALNGYKEVKTHPLHNRIYNINGETPDDIINIVENEIKDIVVDALKDTIFDLSKDFNKSDWDNKIKMYDNDLTDLHE